MNDETNIDPTAEDTDSQVDQVDQVGSSPSAEATADQGDAEQVGGESSDAASEPSDGNAAAKPQPKRISQRQAIKMLKGGGVTGPRADRIVKDTVDHLGGVMQFGGVQVRIDPELDAEEASGDEGTYPDGSVVGAGGVAG